MHTYVRVANVASSPEHNNTGSHSAERNLHRGVTDVVKTRDLLNI